MIVSFNILYPSGSSREIRDRFKYLQEKKFNTGLVDVDMRKLGGIQGFYHQREVKETELQAQLRPQGSRAT